MALIMAARVDTLGLTGGHHHQKSMADRYRLMMRDLQLMTTVCVGLKENVIGFRSGAKVDIPSGRNPENSWQLSIIPDGKETKQKQKQKKSGQKVTIKKGGPKTMDGNFLSATVGYYPATC